MSGSDTSSQSSSSSGSPNSPSRNSVHENTNVDESEYMNGVDDQILEQVSNAKSPLEAILMQLDPKLIPVMITVGTYSACVAGHLFPLDLDKDISSGMQDTDSENENDSNNIDKNSESDITTNGAQNNKSIQNVSNTDYVSDEEEDEDSAEEMMFKTFVTKVHDGSVDSLSTHGTYLISGSTDETVCLFNMKKNVLEGEVKVARGPITKVLMLNAHHDFIVASGKNLTLFSQITPKGYFEVVWQVDNAHKRPIADMDVHPSGKALLTVGSDGRLKMWDLLAGRCSFDIHLDGRPDYVRWSPQGGSFAYNKKGTLVIHSSTTGNTLLELKHSMAITTMRYLNEYLLAVGFRNGDIRIYDIVAKELVHLIEKIHQSRIKDIAVEEINVLEYLMVTASSDGIISVFRVKEDSIQRQCTEDLNTRLHCVAINFLKNVSRRLKSQYGLLEKRIGKHKKGPFSFDESTDHLDEESDTDISSLSTSDISSEDEKAMSKKRKRTPEIEAKPQKKAKVNALSENKSNESELKNESKKLNVKKIEDVNSLKSIKNKKKKHQKK